MMKDDRRLNHRLKKQLFARAAIVNPACFPCIMRSMKLARVVQINARDVVARIRQNVLVRVSRALFYSSLLASIL